MRVRDHLAGVFADDRTVGGGVLVRGVKDAGAARGFPQARAGNADPFDVRLWRDGR